jgi:hypothetical protein
VNYRSSYFILTCLGLGFAFLYIPIFSMVVFSFNASKLVTVWDAANSPTLKWYYSLINNEEILDAAWISLKVAVINASGSVILGFAYGKESVPVQYLGTVSGAINIGNMIGPTLLQPGIGRILEQHWTGTLATPPSVTFAGGGGSSFGQAGDAPLADSLIFGAPPLPLSGVLAGSVELSRLSAARILTAPHSPRGFDSVGAAPGPRAATTASAPMTPSERFVHTLFNLLGAGSSALVLLLGTTPFAALLALFMIAALGVGRLQYAMPALGRSVDFARRERPG